MAVMDVNMRPIPTTLRGENIALEKKDVKRGRRGLSERSANDANIPLEKRSYSYSPSTSHAKKVQNKTVIYEDEKNQKSVKECLLRCLNLRHCKEINSLQMRNAFLMLKMNSFLPLKQGNSKKSQHSRSTDFVSPKKRRFEAEDASCREAYLSDVSKKHVFSTPPRSTTTTEEKSSHSTPPSASRQYSIFDHTHPPSASRPPKPHAFNNNIEVEELSSDRPSQYIFKNLHTPQKRMTSVTDNDSNPHDRAAQKNDSEHRRSNVDLEILVKRLEALETKFQNIPSQSRERTVPENKSHKNEQNSEDVDISVKQVKSSRGSSMCNNDTSSKNENTKRENVEFTNFCSQLSKASSPEEVKSILNKADSRESKTDQSKKPENVHTPQSVTTSLSPLGAQGSGNSKVAISGLSSYQSKLSSWRKRYPHVASK